MKLWPRRTETPRGRLLSHGTPQAPECVCSAAHMCEVPTLCGDGEGFMWDGLTDWLPCQRVLPWPPRRLGSTARYRILAPGAEWACGCGTVYSLDGEGRWVAAGEVQPTMADLRRRAGER